MSYSNEIIEDKSYEKSAFIMGVVAFFAMLFIVLIPTIIAGVGMYFSVKANNKLYLLMNLFVFLGSIMLFLLVM